MKKLKKKFDLRNLYYIISFIILLLSPVTVFARGENKSKSPNSSVFGVITFILFAIGTRRGKNLEKKRENNFLAIFLYKICIVYHC